MKYQDVKYVAQYKVWDSVRKSIWDPVRLSTHRSVRSVRDSVQVLIWGSVKDSVRNSVWNSIERDKT